MQDLSRQEWDDISQRLRDPFEPSNVKFRVQSNSNVIAYIDARDVQDRLDQVVGAGNWSFRWEPLQYDDKHELILAKGILTIHGITKEDIGDNSNQDKSKGTVSDCFKRAAVHWGIARYLYDLGTFRAAVNKYEIPPQELKRLRAGLPKPGQAPNTPIQLEEAQPQDTQQNTQQATPAVQRESSAPSGRATAPSTPPAKPTDLGLLPATEEQKDQIRAALKQITDEVTQRAYVKYVKSTYFSALPAKSLNELLNSLKRDQAKHWLDHFKEWQLEASPAPPSPTPPPVASTPSPATPHEMAQQPIVPEIEWAASQPIPPEMRYRPNDPHSPSRNGMEYLPTQFKELQQVLVQFGSFTPLTFEKDEQGFAYDADGDIQIAIRGAVMRFASEREAGQYLTTLLRQEISEGKPPTWTRQQLTNALKLFEAVEACIFEHSEDFVGDADTLSQDELLSA